MDLYDLIGLTTLLAFCAGMFALGLFAPRHNQYPPAEGWFEINDVAETNGSAVRLKTSYRNSPEFTDKLLKEMENIHREVLNESSKSKPKKPKRRKPARR